MIPGRPTTLGGEAALRGVLALEHREDESGDGGEVGGGERVADLAAILVEADVEASTPRPARWIDPLRHHRQDDDALTAKADPEEDRVGIAPDQGASNRASDFGKPMWHHHDRGQSRVERIDERQVMSDLLVVGDRGPDIGARADAAAGRGSSPATKLGANLSPRHNIVRIRVVLSQPLVQQGPLGSGERELGPVVLVIDDAVPQLLDDL